MARQPDKWIPIVTRLLGNSDRTVHDAGSVLVRELELLLYALVVAGPLLAIGGAGMLAGRSVRRRADERLLDRS